LEQLVTSTTISDSDSNATPASSQRRTRAAYAFSAILPKAYAACELLTWFAMLNAAWIAFTLFGGIAFGIGPATVTAHALSRARLRGDGDKANFLRTFLATYRREWFRANALLLPAVLVAVALWFNIQYLNTNPFRMSVLAEIACWAAALIAAAVYGVLVPMYTHYDLPLRRYIATASRFIVCNPGPAALILLAAGGIVLATVLLPALIVFVNIGAWIHINTALCLSIFATNDERVAASTGTSASTTTN
jgi:uncharacterized membrane protein YesL